MVLKFSKKIWDVKIKSKVLSKKAFNKSTSLKQELNAIEPRLSSYGFVKPASNLCGVV